ncbi:hypothetical protein DEJ49_10505 [Streptomyces venezuelae]|uniref:Uncharacterized protein n=1 Tax=Streptomyces venezuelae TaxID=54571 RepID=A0A5P2CF34_STRVZ|nr:hypothetical protein [Streptomyces venezuelae]QES41385.1 hypothetical protein DEJ49_10505 [Streptomyces venezuelae]
MADVHPEGTALFPIDARDKLTLRLQNAVNGFVDSPRDAVENADRILEEAIADLTHTLTERRNALRTTWQSHATEVPPTAPDTPASPAAGTATGTTPAATPPAGDTEQLRLALQDYRETAERLLRL